MVTLTTNSRGQFLTFKQPQTFCYHSAEYMCSVCTSGIVLYRCHDNSFLQVVPLSMINNDQVFMDYMIDSNDRSVCLSVCPSVCLNTYICTAYSMLECLYNASTDYNVP